MRPEPDENGVILRLEPSAGRRVLALGVLYLLGCLLVWLALARPPAIGWAAFLVAMGALALLAAEALRRATAHSVEMTIEGLRDTAGRTLALWEDIERVERGPFAFKPSNGFVLVLRTAAPRGWAPGLWWRIGRRVGVGGVTPQRMGRFMAEQIAVELALRKVGDD